MIWIGFQVGIGLFLFGLALALIAWLLGLGVDVLDWWSSRITTDEAVRRARLAMYGRWPPDTRHGWTAGRAAALIVGLVLIAVLQTMCRGLTR